MKNHSSKSIKIVFLLIFSVTVIMITPLIGIKFLSLSDVFSFNETANREHTIFWKMRLPRALMAFSGGAVFAISGMVFQAIFRNPLVSPFTLGISAGASLGAAIYIWLGFSFTILTFSGISIFSFSGASFSIAIIWMLANMKDKIATTTMLLAGVAVSFSFASLIMLIQYVSGIGESVRITRWLMGGLVVFGYDSIRSIVPLATGGLLLTLFYRNELNLFTVGEELAISRGMNTTLVIRVLFLGISIMIGGTVSLCGPIAFIGIISPHICRLVIGHDHRYLAPATFLFGGSFLTICDTLARTLCPPAEIPVGVITSLLGGPFFLWILIRRPPGSNHWI